MWFRLYLAVLTVVGAGAVYLAASAMGPGVSTDAARMMSTAESLARGGGLRELSGLPLTQFPPLYSMILAAGSVVFGADVFVVGWVLCILVFGAVIWFSGILFMQAFRDDPVLAYLATFVVASSSSVIQISANIASDPLFLLMTILFMMVAAAYLKTGSARYAALTAAITIISCFQRYAGLSLVITGSLIAAFSFRQHPGKALAAALLFAIVTGAPITAWGMLHNAPVNGTVFGGRLPPDAAGNLTSGLEKVLYWFIPLRIIDSLGPIQLGILMAGVGALIILATGAREWAVDLQRPGIAPNVAFLIVYSAVLVFNISYVELKGLKVDRVHLIMLPSLLIFLGTVTRRLLDGATNRFGTTAVHALTVMLFAAWSAYPISRSWDYVRESRAHGDVSSYNSINKDHILTSELAQFMSGLDLAGMQLYSNGTDTVWFITRRRVRPLPLILTEQRQAALLEQYKDWPNPWGPGYVVWIVAEARKAYYATPQEVSDIASLTELFREERAQVYYVEAR